MERLVAFQEAQHTAYAPQGVKNCCSLSLITESKVYVADMARICKAEAGCFTEAKLEFLRVHPANQKSACLLSSKHRFSFTSIKYVTHNFNNGNIQVLQE